MATGVRYGLGLRDTESQIGAAPRRPKPFGGNNLQQKSFLGFFEKKAGLPLTKQPIIYIIGSIREKENTMTKTQFITYISYSTVRPTRIGVGRWTAMIRWAKVNGFIS